MIKNISDIIGRKATIVTEKGTIVGTVEAISPFKGGDDLADVFQANWVIKTPYSGTAIIRGEMIKQVGVSSGEPETPAEYKKSKQSTSNETIVPGY